MPGSEPRSVFSWALLGAIGTSIATATAKSEALVAVSRFRVQGFGVSLDFPRFPPR